ncbi:MAG: hypothetical protein J6P42_03005, partial [Oscillospiraceae bacterium]|nr:hypothetical protein [Oscillospiraceae bacterium]
DRKESNKLLPDIAARVQKLCRLHLIPVNNHDNLSNGAAAFIACSPEQNNDDLLYQMFFLLKTENRTFKENPAES